MNTESYSIQWSQQRTLTTLRTSPAWVPHLQLTDEERYVVETKGTVLLLGRSGTGKTICICNRMDYDRQRMAHDSSFTQLFVARSQRLCRYVSETISVTPNTCFTTFDGLLIQLENILPKVTNVRDTFSQSDQDIDPLLVWTSIRSFIKGSIEATHQPLHTIEREDFLSLELFGRNGADFLSFSVKLCTISMNGTTISWVTLECGITAIV